MKALTEENAVAQEILKLQNNSLELDKPLKVSYYFTRNIVNFFFSSYSTNPFKTSNLHVQFIQNCCSFIYLFISVVRYEEVPTKCWKGVEKSLPRPQET